MANMIQKELERLQCKLKEATGNYEDTGLDRYWKLQQKYEGEISEIEKLTDTSLPIKIAVMENDFTNLIVDIKKKIGNLRLDYPHDDGLILLSNYYEKSVEKWKREHIK